jgi:hypothetical protein
MATAFTRVWMNKSPAHAAISPYFSVSECLCVSGTFSPLKRDQIRLRLKVNIHFYTYYKLKVTSVHMA